MLLIRKLAWRYLRGKRSGNAVPVLSRISMVAIAVGSCAMIVLFSIFNGFENLIKDLYKAFYPEIKITAVQGKFFELENSQLKMLESVRGIRAVSRSVEDNVLLNADEDQKVITLKGIDRHFSEVNNIRPYIYEGADSVSSGPFPTALIGLQTANQLGINLNNVFSSLSVYYPNTQMRNPSLNPQSAFQALQLKPAGIFRIQDELDSKYILAPLEKVQSLFLQPGKYSSLEISLSKNARPDEIKKELAQILGDGFLVATRYEQNRTLYMVMKTEKWAVYGILLLVLLIASFNMVGALTLLVLEKQKDLAILKAMGADKRSLQGIFISEGILWALTGGVLGVLLGAALCLGQQYFQWIKLQGAFIIDAYPVQMRWQDFLLVIFTVILVGFLASVYPALKSTRAAGTALKSS